jgi:hypothetical protein
MNNVDLESPQEQKTETVIIRLTPSERTQLEEESQKAGVSISAFIRLLLRNYSNGIRFEKKV